jgi:branched-chain amino acid transport system permease protein
VHAGGLVLIYVMIAVSLLILAGWGGQVSLGHFALVATGAVVGAGLSSRFGWSFWVALPAAALVGSALAVGLGLPALRLKGLYLAAVTLAFAAAVPRILFDSTYFGWLLPSGQIQRPSLFGIDLASETAFYYVLAVLAAAAVYIGYKLRRTRPGRVLIALRDNEPSAQSVGVSPLTTRLGAFALSGFIAAFAGVLYVHYEGVLTVKDFLPQASLDVFLLLVVGGLGNLTGAVLGALVGAGLRIVTPDHAGLFTGAGAVLILLFAPGGISQLVYAARDAIYRVVALRLHLVVPSLFEDFDLQAHARRKLPLAKPIGGLGLAALPVQRRYSQTSWLWRHTRRGEEVAT